MAVFPSLKTGAMAQYPLQRTLRFKTEAVRFLDGSQQKYRIYGAGLRRWSLKLNLLDDSELAAVIDFMEQQGTSPFAFKDPLTGDTIPRCALGGDQFEAGTLGEMLSTAEVTIEELP